MEDAIEHCRGVFSEQGKLATALPGFVARPAQIELAQAITKALNQGSMLVAEAGTGTGKTFAYLIPCLLNEKKTIVSTATKTLQDQLFHKDLPLLLGALGLARRVQNLKGRANYLCRHRIHLHAEEGRFVSPHVAQEVLLIREKLAQMEEGERGELPEISEDSPVWPYVTSTTENCLGNECLAYQNCFLMKARKRALEADLVVINHHLFLADSNLKEEGFGELLPGAEAIIFDEAHQLAEIAAHFQGQRLSTRQIRELVDDLLREWPILPQEEHPLKEFHAKTDTVIHELLSTLPDYEERYAWHMLCSRKSFMDAWQQLLQLIENLRASIELISVEAGSGLARCQKRLLQARDTLNFFATLDKTQILWLERFKQSLVWHATPFDIADSFSNLLARQSCAYVFTSATLTMASSFDCFIKPLGLTQVNTLSLPSPFDYQQQAILYLPRELPDPKEAHYYEKLVQKALPIINGCQGRCFFLFTSHRALKIVAQLLADTLKYPLLIQGEEAKPILLARFRQLGNAVLLGTATFWEGVDVKGEALSCVIIDKLPFANPRDPVISGKMNYLKSRGLSGFDELSLPAAVLALKQGVGRLIRDFNDKGVLMIADPRLTGRDYGQRIFASLPSLPKTRNEQTVLTFIKQLAFNHEPVGH